MCDAAFDIVIVKAFVHMDRRGKGLYAFFRFFRKSSVPGFVGHTLLAV
jgi:hypothetical protein